MPSYAEKIKVDFIYEYSTRHKKDIIETDLIFKGRGIRKMESPPGECSFLNIHTHKKFTYFVTFNALLKLKKLYSHNSVDELFNHL